MALLGLPDNKLIKLVESLLATDQGRAALANNDMLPLDSPVPAKLRPHVSVAEVIAVAKMVCDVAGVACPIIQSLP